MLTASWFFAAVGLSLGCVLGVFWFDRSNLWAFKPVEWETEPHRERPVHCTVQGASGSGKSVLLLRKFIEAARHNDSFCFLADPHGALAKEACKKLIEEGFEDRILWDD